MLNYQIVEYVSNKESEYVSHMFEECTSGEMPDRMEFRTIGEVKCQNICGTNAVRWTVRHWFSTCQIECQIECQFECQTMWQMWEVVQQTIAILYICLLMGITRSKDCESSSAVFFASLLEF